MMSIIIIIIITITDAPLYQSCIFLNIVKKKGVGNQTHVKKELQNA